MRLQIAANVPEAKLKCKTPIITPSQTASALILRTDGPPFVKADTPPCGIIFVDDSFLTIYEKWSIPERKLLGYKYLYQHRGGFIRFDMDEKKRRRFPQHHVQVETLNKIHIPTGGPVEFNQVLEMIAKQLLPRNP